MDPVSAQGLYGVDSRLIESKVIFDAPGTVIEEVELTSGEAYARSPEIRAHVLRVDPVSVMKTPPQPEVSVDSTRVTGKQAMALHGLDTVHERSFKGKGQVIAVLDTGITPEQAERLKAQGRLVGVFTHVPGEDGYDRGTNGHGPWCVEMAAMAAPEAKMISVQVLRSKDSGPNKDDNGSGANSWIIAGGQTAKSNGATVNSRSLGGDGDPGDASCRAVNAERASGISCPCAAGNEQRGTTALTADRHAPGCAERAISCAACDSDRVVAEFSSWGNTVDVMGIGVLVEAGGRYMSGTSMWTPLLAGIVACLRSAKNDPDAVGTSLFAGCVDSSYEAYKEGYGFVRADAALDKLVGSGPSPKPPAYLPNLPRYTRTQIRATRIADIKECVLTGKDTDSSPLVEIGHLKPKGA